MNNTNVLIVYYSKHHNNTLKLVELLKEKYNFDIISYEKFKDSMTDKYKTIGFASGIYGFKFPKEIVDLINCNLKDKNVFLIYTCASNYKHYDKEILKRLKVFNINYLGCFSCKGYCTYGPFKMFNGINKANPNNDDIMACFNFIEKNILPISL